MQKFRVIYAANPEFAIPPLAALLENGRFQVTSVICSEDKKAGRGQKLTPPPIAQYIGRYPQTNTSPPLTYTPSRTSPQYVNPNLTDSYMSQFQANKIFIHQPRKIQEIERVIRLEKPDFLVVFAYGQILPPTILTVPKFGCINIHPSILPLYRGATPVQEAILNGDAETGVTFFLMNEKMDEGDILKSIKTDIKTEDTTKMLLQRLSLLAAAELPKLLTEFASGKILPTPQDKSKATYCRKIQKDDGRLDFADETAEIITRKIRAYTPWPGCYFLHRRKRIKILAALAKPYNSEQKNSSGLIKVSADKKRLEIGTKHGALLPLVLQIEGKKPQPIEEFLKGYTGFLQA